MCLYGFKYVQFYNDPTNATNQLPQFTLLVWKSERGDIISEWHAHIKQESLRLSLRGTSICYTGFRENMVFLYSVMASTRKPGLPALGGTFRLGISNNKVKKIEQIPANNKPMHSWSGVYSNWFFMHPFLDRHLIKLLCPSSMQLLPSLMIEHPQYRPAADVFQSLQVPLNNKQHGVQLSFAVHDWIHTPPSEQGENVLNDLVTFTCYMEKHQMLGTLQSGQALGKYSKVSPHSSLLLQF